MLSKKIKDIINTILFNRDFYLLKIYDKEMTKRVTEAIKKGFLTFNYYEAFIVETMFKNSLKVDGEIVEVGVYKGGTALLFCALKGNKPIHLFDTFEGLPDIEKIDESTKSFYAGNFKGNLEEVKDNLKEFLGVYFYKGYFPNTAKPIENKRFSFVHLDCDLYKSTKEALEFFYPRMNKQGIIISHDYINTKGVKKAFDEFFYNKPEIIIAFPLSNQCMIVKN